MVKLVNQGVSTQDIFSQKMYFLYTKIIFIWTDRNLLKLKYSMSCNHMNIGKKLQLKTLFSPHFYDPCLDFLMLPLSGLYEDGTTWRHKHPMMHW